MPHDPRVSLCVQVAGAQASSKRGSAARWTVTAWTTGGSVPDATVRLRATPAGGGTPGFSFGCGKENGQSACDLGAMDAKSAPRQLQAQLTVPVSASAVKSVRLTVIGGTAHLTKAPEASATVSITAPPPKSQAAPPPKGQTPSSPASEAAQNPPNELPFTVTSPLPVGSLPGIPPGIPPGVPPAAPPVSPTLSPGGNAASLFPTLHPKQSPSSTQPPPHPHTRPIADTSALPEGAPVVGAQLAGLAALALAFIVAVARLSIRRRPTSTPPTTDTPLGKNTPPAAPGTEQGNGTPPEAPKDAPATDEK